MEIKTLNVEKKYYAKRALYGTNLTLLPGKSYGIFGPNGSGKTTLMKILSGLTYPSQGTVLIDGAPLSHEIRAKVTYAPTANYLYGDMTIKQAAHYTGSIYGNFSSEHFHKLLRFFGLSENLKIKNLSTGMLGQLKVVLALSRNTEFYMFDEPLNGIDPVCREKIKEALLEGQGENKTFLITSHLVYELESLVDEVIFIRDGEIVLQGPADELRETHHASIEDVYKEVFAHA